ncbi:MAG: hypothetical protein CL797_03155 [Chromatiales bacterium]|jgi:TolB-like protein|nr:hypothetical protein [Chromatiales bacterium]
MTTRSDSQPQLNFCFGDFTVDVLLREVKCGDEILGLEPKVFDLLVYLLARRNRVVGKDELLTALWPEVIVTEASLARCVTKCRQALGDDGDRQTIIKTARGRGYRFVAELTADDSHTTPGTATPSVPAETVKMEQPSIVVLPFNNFGGHADDDILAMGLTEDIIVDLSRNGWLFVIARNSSFTYKGQVLPSQTVASELGVRYVVEGSVQRMGERLRVSAELVDANAGTQEWAERYDRPISDLFTVQDEISRGIVTTLDSELRRAEGRRAREADPDTLSAWGLVHRGMAVSWSNFNSASNLRAEHFYRRATEIAPEDARAHAFLANNLAMKVVNGWVQGGRRPIIDEARQHGVIWTRHAKPLTMAAAWPRKPCWAATRHSLNTCPGTRPRVTASLICCSKSGSRPLPARAQSSFYFPGWPRVCHSDASPGTKDWPCDSTRHPLCRSP